MLDTTTNQCTSQFCTRTENLVACAFNVGKSLALPSLLCVLGANHFLNELPGGTAPQFFFPSQYSNLNIVVIGGKGGAAQAYSDAIPNSGG